MTQQCTVCDYDWNVSPFQRIPAGGYVCPICSGQMKRGKGKEQIQADMEQRRRQHMEEMEGKT